MAPRAHRRQVPPAEPRVRRVLRLPRRVAQLPAIRDRAHRHLPRQAGGPGEGVPDRRLRPRGRGVHRAARQGAVLPVLGVQRRPRPDGGGREVPEAVPRHQGPEAADLRGHAGGPGRRHRPRAGQAARGRDRGRHADLLRQRQRRPGGGQRLGQRPAPRRQGDDLGGRHPRAVPGAVEGQAAGRQGVRPAGHPARLPADRPGRRRRARSNPSGSSTA